MDTLSEFEEDVWEINLLQYLKGILLRPKATFEKVEAHKFSKYYLFIFFFSAIPASIYVLFQEKILLTDELVSVAVCLSWNLIITLLQGILHAVMYFIGLRIAGGAGTFKHFIVSGFSASVVAWFGTVPFTIIIGIALHFGTFYGMLYQITLIIFYLGILWNSVLLILVGKVHVKVSYLTASIVYIITFVLLFYLGYKVDLYSLIY